MAGDFVVDRSGSESVEDAGRETEKQTPQPTTPPNASPKKPTLLKRAWAKTGLDLVTIILMLKGALPPIICLAAYQSDAWAKKYTTLGYLSAIMSFLSLAIQPRAKFVQSTLVSILCICFAAAVSLLQIRCVTSARQHSTPAAASHATVTGGSGGKQAVAYNSSASVVSGCFMFVEIYLGNMVRAKRPQLLVPSIQFCIFAIVASSYSVTFPTMKVGEAFVKRLLETFLTGIGIAAGVSFFIIPMTSRTIAGKQMAGILGLMKASMNAHSQYLMSLTRYSTPQANGQAADEKPGVNATNGKRTNTSMSGLSAEAQALRNLRNTLAGLFGKLNLELTFARKEIAWGYLRPHHYGELIDLFRDIILPIAGMTTFIDIMQSVKDNKSHLSDSTAANSETMAAIQRLEAQEWDEVMTLSHDQAIKFKAVLCQGLTHVSYQLKFVKKPKATKGDVEKSAGGPPVPGESDFTAMLEAEISGFARHRETALQRWCDHKGVELPSSFWDDPSQHYSMKELQDMTETVTQKHNQQQLYLILYIEYLTFSMGKAILKLSQYADERVSDGTMIKPRLIFPGLKKIAKLIQSAWTEEDSGGVDHMGEGPGNIYLGDSFKARKNPEHLPPSNWFEKSTDLFRLIPAHFRSEEANFGFRAAVAVMSIAVLNFLHQTQHFYQDQRIMWALLMIAISMSPQTGQGIFGFLARVFGTVVAMVASIVIWYMADQKTGAILPLFYIYICCGVWFVVKKPQFAIAGILSVVTGILILGYELQERKIGIKIATSNGQPYYKIYILAPYRLATVVAGMAVCFIWTYFPYPITTHTTLRKDMGATIYLLANFYSIVHSTIDTRLHMGIKGRPDDKNSPMYPLDKARHRGFKKCLIMLNRLREHSSFAKYDINFGGPFPIDQYDKLIQSMQNMFNYMALMSYSSGTFLTEPEKEETQWMADFRRFTADLNITSHEMTSTLCLTSFSVTNAQPLPPYMKLPKPYALADRMESIDPEVLSVKHVSEPCYAAFAILEVASSLVTQEMSNIVKGVQGLVGEVDFSFHMIDDSETSSLDNGEGGKGKLA